MKIEAIVHLALLISPSLFLSALEERGRLLNSGVLLTNNVVFRDI